MATAFAQEAIRAHETGHLSDRRVLGAVSAIEYPGAA
jgi:hypothetical protein